MSEAMKSGFSFFGAALLCIWIAAYLAHVTHISNWPIPDWAAIPLCISIALGFIGFYFLVTTLIYKIWSLIDA